MDCIKKKVNEEIARGWIGCNRDCPYHPSHFCGQDCTYCYCPFYPCNDTDFGSNLVGKRGNEVWNCSDCLFIHRPEPSPSRAPPAGSSWTIPDPRSWSR